MKINYMAWEYQNRFYCPEQCLLLFCYPEGVSIWERKIVTHLVISQIHTPSLNCQKAGLVTDFKTMMYCCSGAEHPWMHLSSCVTCTGNVKPHRGVLIQSLCIVSDAELSRADVSQPGDFCNIFDCLIEYSGIFLEGGF